jgi:hypothetical protein
MKPAARTRALAAYRLSKKITGGKELAARLKVENSAAAHELVHQGYQILQAESYRLTEREWAVMTVIARMSVRQLAFGGGSVTTPSIDWAAGKYSGWCASVVDRRLRARRHSETAVEDYDKPRLNLVEHSKNGHIWLTPTGWMFVWATGLIKPSWKVPA